MAVQLQMSWNLNRLHHKRETGPPLGLKNLGNSCYLNSVLQCLTYTPPLANFCLSFQHSSACDSVGEAGSRKRDCPFCIIEKRIVRSLSADLTLDAPSKVVSCLRIFAGHFRHDHQEDAHEFLRYVIDACHNSCLRLKKLQRCQSGGGAANGSTTGVKVNDSTIVKEIFGGALQSQVKCLSCGAESNKIDEIMDISLDVLHSTSLNEAMQKFFQPEVLDGNNKYRCGSCKKLVAARKQMSMIQAPNVLVIQLKRFEGIFGGKIDKAISFEEALGLSNFMSKESQDRHPEYSLFGAIVHSGFSPESGHYYAYVKDARSRWYCCNDSYVSLTTPQEVLSEKVYILFFSRTNLKPAYANSGSDSSGVKSCDSNGNIRLKNPKASSSLLNTVHSKQHGPQYSLKDVSARSNVDKVSCSASVKLNSSGNSNSKRVFAFCNGKVDPKNPVKETNGDARESICMEKNKKYMPLPINRNGVAKSIDSENDQALGTAGHKGQIQSIGVSAVKEEIVEGNGPKDGACNLGHKGQTQSIGGSVVKEEIIERNGPKDGVDDAGGADCHELHNGVENGHFCASGSKRKSHDTDSCILLAKDAHSQAKREKLIEVLATEASSALRSCGWMDKVFGLMHARKKLCERETGPTQSSGVDELKKKLIAEAKASRILGQIPESLKQELIERLRSSCER